MPADTSTARSARDVNTPSTNPIPELAMPMMPASSSTDCSTCGRLAPSSRSVANSRLRWASTIVNVL